MDAIGYLDSERLSKLSPEYWKDHEFCFYLHDNLLQMLIDYESSGAHNWVTDAFRKVMSEKGVPEQESDVLSFLRENNLTELYRHHLISHLVMALTGDMLHFLYEALKCLEKRKFSVAFSLLRKPLKENLLFLCWILSDEGDFISKFSEKTHKSLNDRKPEERRKIISGAVEKLPMSDTYDADLIHDVIYSKSHEFSFEPVWQRATHLITSKGSLLETNEYEINFIFENPFDEKFCDIAYRKLPYVMMFLSHVALECFSLILKINEKTYSHLIITSLGCYETLYRDRGKMHLAGMLNKHLSPIMKCIHCNGRLRINKRNATQLYIKESMDCKNCGLVSQIPLYWLLSRAEIKISRG